MADDPLKGVKSMLRAVLMSSKEGVLASNVQGEYRGITGEFIPFRKHGHSTLDAFLLTMPDVVRAGRNKDGTPTYFAVADESTLHIQKMVEKQKSKSTRTKRSNFNSRSFRRPVFRGSFGSKYTPGKYGPSKPHFNPAFRTNTYQLQSTHSAPRFMRHSMSTLTHTVDAESFIQDVFTESRRKPLPRPAPRTEYSSLSGSTSGQPPIFQHTGISTSKSNIGSTWVKFQPVSSIDIVTKDNVQQNIRTFHQCITAMKQYEVKSLEELRWEDYTSNGKGLCSNSVMGLLESTASSKSAQSNIGSTWVKFQPVSNIDIVTKDNVQQTLRTFHQCITAMKQYEVKSLEELRWEDYTNGKGLCSNSVLGLLGSTANSPSMSGFSSNSTASTGFISDRNYKEILHGHLNRHGGGPPIYLVFQAGSSMQQGFLCTVKFKGEAFTTDGAYRSKSDAEHAAAREACKELNIDTSNVKVIESRKFKTKYDCGGSKREGIASNSMVLSFEDDREDRLAYDEYFAKEKAPTKKYQQLSDENLVKTRLKEILSNRKNGLWDTRVPVEYKEKFGEAPDNLIERLKQWNDIARADNVGATGRIIFYPVEDKVVVQPAPPQPEVSSLPKPQVAEPSIHPPAAQRSPTQPSSSSPLNTLSAGSVINVYVTHINSGSHFFMQRTDSKINDLMEEIALEVEMGNIVEQVEKINPGTPCLALFTEDEAYYRAEIKESKQTERGIEVTVFYIDFGNVEILPVVKLKKIPKKFCLYLPQAFVGAMNSVLPYQWNKNAQEEFQRLAIGEDVELKAKVLLSGPAICIVDLYTMSNPTIPLSMQLPLMAAPLIYPKEQYWDVYVCFVNDSPSDLMVRLVGDEHSAKLEELENILTEYCQTEGKDTVKPEQCRPGYVYIAYSVAPKNQDELELETAFRVRLNKIIDDKVECFWLDHGDTECLNITDLHLIKPEHLHLPFQAMPCSLHGLEHGIDTSEKFIDQLYSILGQSYVAEVIERGEKLSLTLIDTSGENDININERLSKYILDEELAPKLPEIGEGIEGYVSYVTKKGTIYFQPEGTGLDRLTELMEEMQAHYSKKISADEFVSKPEVGKVVCVKYSVDGFWYRAIIKELFPNRKIKVHFVDYGNMDVVSFSDLRELWKASEHLCKLPFQAVECDLKRLPPIGRVWTEASTERLKELTPSNQTFILKVHYKGAKDELPSVELTTKFDEEISLNNLLYQEDHLFIPGAIYKPQTEPPLESGDSNTQLTTTDKNHYDNNNGIPSPRANIEETKQDRAAKEIEDLAIQYARLTTNTYNVLPLPQEIEIPEMGEFLDIHVLRTSHPGDFVCTPYSSVNLLNAMTYSMDEFYKRAPKKDLDSFEETQVYAGFNETHWCRIRIKEKNNDYKATVYSLDYGEYSSIPLSAIQPLAIQFRDLPFQAIKCEILGIKPDSKDGWSEKARTRFKQLIDGKDLVSVICSQNTNNGKLSMKLIDTSTEVDVFISEMMMKEGLTSFS